MPLLSKDLDVDEVCGLTAPGYVVAIWSRLIIRYKPLGHIEKTFTGLFFKFYSSILDFEEETFIQDGKKFWSV